MDEVLANKLTVIEELLNDYDRVNRNNDTLIAEIGDDIRSIKSDTEFISEIVYRNNLLLLLIFGLMVVEMGLKLIHLYINRKSDNKTEEDTND